RGIPETQVSYGLLGYPVLMATDILCVQADRVPVGQDQRQHVEMARDFAQAFNAMFDRQVFKIPKTNVSDPIRVPGIDGAAKMGKSDGNTIALLEEPKKVLKKVKGIPTQTEPGGDMQPGTQALYRMVELCCPGDVHTKYLKMYTERAGKFFGEMKSTLADHIVELIEPIQEAYQTLKDDDVREILDAGATKVRVTASETLAAMHDAIGIKKRSLSE
ncbi:MAG: tryptophan--tRNA ligase, partial [Verrucomicrobiota bacterium]